MASFELIHPGRRAWFTLVSDGALGVMPLEISYSDRKPIRTIGGFLFDCEGFARAKAEELNNEMHPGRFQPWRKYRVLTFPHSLEDDE